MATQKEELVYIYKNTRYQTLTLLIKSSQSDGSRSRLAVGAYLLGAVTMRAEYQRASRYYYGVSYCAGIKLLPPVNIVWSSVILVSRCII